MRFSVGLTTALGSTLFFWSDRKQAEDAVEGFYAFPEIRSWFRHIEKMISFEYADVEQISHPAASAANHD
jgi:hypothetical protein